MYIRHQNYIYNTQFMKFFTSLFFFLLFATISFSQVHTVRGFLYEKKNGEPVLFEKVMLLNPKDSSIYAGAMTDVNGFFTIPKVQIGKYVVKVENPNFVTIIENIEIKTPSGITNLRYDLAKPEFVVKELEEAVISAESKKKKTEVNISQIKLDKKAVERIPSIGSENDIVGAISVTPGVVTTGDQGGQMYVRGGTPIQNKVMLDGMTIYQPFHSIGFFSIFETELIKNVDIYTGGFDAKYGERISSIMDITYKDGNKKDFAGKLSVSPFLAKIVLEGPFKRQKDGSNSPLSFLLTGKQSLLDQTAKRLYPNVNGGDGLPFNFTDIYGKITYSGGTGSKVNFFGFHNNDSVNYGIANINFKQSGGGMNFQIVPSSSSTLIKGHVNGSSYSTIFVEDQKEPRSSSIGGFDLGFDFVHFLKNGSDITYGFNFGGFNTKFITMNEFKQTVSLDNFTSGIGSYMSSKIIRNRWVIQPSMRIQYYVSYSTFSPEPRLGLKYNANEKLRMKFSGGRFSQNFTSASSDRDVVNLFNSLLSAPTDVQAKFVTQMGKEKNVKNGLQYAWHAIMGFEFDLTKHLSMNLEGYYKYFPQLSNINTNKMYEDGAIEFATKPDVFKKDFIIESGKSYGVDLLLKYSKKRLFIWGVYSYGKSTRWDGFQEYFPVFDRRHNINIVTSYAFGKKKGTELNIRWNLGSGLPFTPNAGFYQGETFQSGITTDYTTTNPSSVSNQLGDFNSQRLPYYHRLDITVKKQFVFKNKTVLESIFSVTNTYNRKNIFYVNRITSKIIYQFPILPSIGVSYKF